MKTKIYWKIREKIINLIFKIKKIKFRFDNIGQSYKEYRSFTEILFSKFFSGAIKAIILVLILGKIDSELLDYGIKNSINGNIFADVIIGELSVSGVILGLYYSNISSIYSTKYASAPKKIALAFQYDRLTVKCLNSISGFIIFGTIILVKLLLEYNVGWISGSVLIIWSIFVVISFGIAGNRIYQLSDVLKIADDTYIILRRVVSKQLKQKMYISDVNYQNYFMKMSSDKIELLKAIQKYTCNSEFADSSSVLDFMCSNLELIEQYWLIKSDLSKDSFWFKRECKYKQWHLINDIEISIALNTGTPLGTKKVIDNYWFEDELMSINRECVKYLIKKNDFGILYSYFVLFSSICKSAIEHKEANYYIGQIDWLKNVIQNSADNINIDQNISFVGIVEYISLLYLDIILESSKYFQNFDIDKIVKSVINGIDTRKSYKSIKAIRGREYIEIYKNILTEAYIEGHRITPDWLIKQFVAKEEFIYVNSLFDVVKEGIEHAYSLSRFFVEKKMYYEACILLARFYEYDSKLSNFYKFANQVEKNLKIYHLDPEDKWGESRLEGVEERFLDYKKYIPEMLMKSSRAFAIKNWDRIEEYPDFLGECYNHVAEDIVESIVNSDKKQFERYYKNLTKMMLLYQEYIRSDFIKNKDLYRIEYTYYIFTYPIAEWAQIGGLGILWGEFFKDKEWSSIVEKTSKKILCMEENELKSIDLASKLIEFVSERNKFMFGIGARDILKTRRNQFVENAIREFSNIEIESEGFMKEIKTDSKLIKAFCPNSLDMGFSSDPSEVFWVKCVNPLLPEEKRYHTRFSWENDLNE